VIRFSVETMFDWTGRGLLISGMTLGGVIEPGMQLGNGTGARARVLAIEPESPRDRREGWTTLLVERTTPRPVTDRTVLVVEETPAVPYTYHVTPATGQLQSVTISEATPGTNRSVTFDRASSRWRSVAKAHPVAPADSREITREEAERILWDLGTMLPADPALRRMLLTPEAPEAPGNA
jgi:hypothetical protein